VRVKRWLPWLTMAMAAVALALVAGSYARGNHQAAPAAKKLRIGLVTDIGGLNDRGFNSLAYKGLQTAQKQLGVTGRVLTSKGPQDYIPNLTKLATGGYDLVIAVGFLMTDATATVAKKYPKVKFAIVDVDAPTMKGKPKNVQGILFREQEVGYIVGVVATLLSRDEKLPKKVGKAAKTPFIASVGGIKIPPVDRFIAGYEYAAKKTVPASTVKHSYSQDFVDQAKCKELATNFFDQGADVVFQVAGGCGLGVIDAAKEKGKWALGVDADQNFVAPGNVATSALKKVDRGVFLTIQKVVKKTYKGGINAVYGAKDGGVSAGKFAPAVPADIKAAAAKAAADIKSGKIKGIPTTVSG
jgi:basic membrane protein A and related proteins